MSHAQLYPACLNFTAYSGQNIQRITRTGRGLRENAADKKRRKWCKVQALSFQASPSWTEAGNVLHARHLMRCIGHLAPVNLCFGGCRPEINLNVQIIQQESPWFSSLIVLIFLFWTFIHVHNKIWSYPPTISFSNCPLPYPIHKTKWSGSGDCSRPMGRYFATSYYSMLKDTSGQRRSHIGFSIFISPMEMDLRFQCKWNCLSN